MKEETSSSKSNSRTGVVRDNSHVIQELNGNLILINLLSLRVAV